LYLLSLFDFLSIGFWFLSDRYTACAQLEMARPSGRAGAASVAEDIAFSAHIDHH
jgi:hypothetical protein